MYSIYFLKESVIYFQDVAIHSRTIAWKIPWTEEPGRLQSEGGCGLSGHNQGGAASQDWEGIQALDGSKASWLS